MRTSLDCITCLIRQTVEASRSASADHALHERVLRDVLGMAAGLDLSEAPPRLTQQVQRRIRQLTGDDDPYRELKQRANEVALAALPALAAEVRSAPDPLSAALRLAIAGNTIDAGANGPDSVDRMEQELSVAYQRPFRGDVDAFRRAVGSARRILFLTDNTGEIVIDRLLAEHLPLERTTFAVRGAPVLNDATRADARFAGLDRLVEVIDNGSDAPGTILSDCSPEFRGRFAAADLIIAKGQGNYETLSEEPRDIFFLFAVKCDVAARHVGLPRGTQALVRSAAGNAAGSRRDRNREMTGIGVIQEAERRASASSGQAYGPVQHPRGGDDMAGDSESGFSTVARDHAMYPRHLGPPQTWGGQARITGPCGDTMEFWITVEDGCVKRVRFTTDGCGSSLACGSMATTLCRGRQVDEAMEITQADILRALGGIPAESEHCALLAASTLRAAFEDAGAETA